MHRRLRWNGQMLEPMGRIVVERVVKVDRVGNHLHPGRFGPGQIELGAVIPLGMFLERIDQLLKYRLNPAWLVRGHEMILAFYRKPDKSCGELNE